MGSRLSARRALISLVLVGGLTGCGDEPAEQTPTPTMAAATETSPAPEPSPTPTPLATSVPLPVMPPEMANNDAAGAEAAVKYFVALYGYAKLERDLDAWEEISDDNCVFCASVTESVSDLLANDHLQTGGRLNLVEISLVPGSAQTGTYIFDALVQQEAFELVSVDGAVVESYDGTVTEGRFVVAQFEGQWRLMAAGTSSED